jgi:hypothetical protein
MKRAATFLLLMLLAPLAFAADPFLLRDLPLGSTVARAQSVVPGLARAESPPPLEAWRAAGPVGEARDIRLVFREGKMISISYATAPGSFARVRQALANMLGPFAPPDDGHWAYEARRGAQRLQVLKRDDGGAWVAWMDTSQFSEDSANR